jgi:hypothetical protein
MMNMSLRSHDPARGLAKQLQARAVELVPELLWASAHLMPGLKTPPPWLAMEIEKASPAAIQTLHTIAKSKPQMGTGRIWNPSMEI